MAHAQSLDARPRRRMALALLATTALAALLGGCTQTGLPFGRSEEPKLSATDAIGAIAQWSAAYNKNPQDPKMVLGYAAALKTIGSRDKALEILTAGYRANQNNGEIAAELGRLALDMGRLDIAQQTLKVAETQGVKDWKTLSAQGTLRAKQGQHAEAQQYFLAALEVQPDAVSVINNLALSYALDGKPNKSEELLRKAVASGHDDKRVRQNLALVLGLQGKFDEARQVASVDMTEQEAKSSMTYLRNMLSNQTQFAAAKSGGANDVGGDDWEPFRRKRRCFEQDRRRHAGCRAKGANGEGQPRKSKRLHQLLRRGRRASRLAGNPSQAEGGRYTDADHAGQRHARTSPGRHTYCFCRSGRPCESPQNRYRLIQKSETGRWKVPSVLSASDAVDGDSSLARECMNVGAVDPHDSEKPIMQAITIGLASPSRCFRSSIDAEGNDHLLGFRRGRGVNSKRSSG